MRSAMSEHENEESLGIEGRGDLHGLGLDLRSCTSLVVSQCMFPEDGVLSQPLGQHGGIPRKGRINL